MVKGVQKHANGGATCIVKDLLDEISVYDKTNFLAYIIYFGGNDCSNNVNIDKYDQLISGRSSLTNEKDHHYF